MVQRVGEDRIPLMCIREKLIECRSISATPRIADAIVNAVGVIGSFKIASVAAQ
jgi:hypothetical protein